MNKNVKFGLMGVIAVGLIANAYLMMTGAYSGGSDHSNAQSSMVANTNAPRAEAPQTRPDADRSVQANPVNDGPTTQITFTTPTHDFGNIPQDSDNRHIFTFTNTGSEPLIIENAKGSCGCTVPQYPKEPIAPGGTGEIEVVYKPGKQMNRQSKTVTITANTEPRTTSLSVTAFVEGA